MLTVVAVMVQMVFLPVFNRVEHLFVFVYEMSIQMLII